MPARLVGKTAIVTGAGSGIGRATARLFANEGASVVVADVDSDGGSHTVELINSNGGAAHFVHGDISEPGVGDRLVRAARDRYGRLHVLINNAGINQASPPTAAWDVPPETWDRVFAVNVRGTHLCTRAAVPALRSAGGGAIVNVASIAASVSVGGAAYAASKGAIASYTRHMAVVLAPHIRVNSVSPGFIWTSLSSGERLGLSAEEQHLRLESYAKRAPLARAGSAEDVARAMLYLASDESSYVTGHDLLVDGGHLVLSS